MAWYDDKTADSEMVGSFRVSVVYDDDSRGLSDAVNDEPVMIFEVDGRGYGYSYSKCLDQSKKNFPPMEILHMIARDRDDSEVLNTVCDMHSYNEWGQTESGKFWGENAEWTRRRYFKTRGALVAAMIWAEFACDLSDLRVESFRSTVWQSGGDYVLAWYQSELDSYAGRKDAVSPLESCQAIVDGEVYGYIVSGPYDDDGEESEDFDDHIESCWGFIGDESYCMAEGKSAAEHLDKEHRKKLATEMADSIAESRPDLAPQYEVTQ